MLSRLNFALKSTLVKSIKPIRLSSSLAKTLAEEIDYEKNQELTEKPKPPSAFKVIDEQGKAEVQLKADGINVTFGIIPTRFADDYEAEAEDEEFEGEDETFPVTIDIKKQDKTLTFFTNVNVDGSFEIEEVELAKSEEESAEGEYKRRSMYLGPKYYELDPSLQDSLSAYLEEKGINEKLGEFIVEYSEWKEQQEYVSWLKNMKDFVGDKN